MFENAHRSPRQLSNSNLRVISLHKNIANIFLRSFEVTRTKVPTKRLLVDTSELNRIIRVTIHNMELESPNEKTMDRLLRFPRQPQSNR